MGTVAVSGGDASRIAALPSFGVLLVLIVAAVAAANILRFSTQTYWPLAISLLLWLPFVPGRVPPAFLMWHGPLVSLVWLLVCGGLVAAMPTRRSQWFADPARAPVLIASLVAIAALIAFSRVPDVIPGGDEPHYLAATQSLIKDADLRVANNYANGDYLEYFPGRLEPHYLKRATSGEIYSIHAPGVSVLILPAFALAGYTGAVWMMIVFAALTAALTWRVAYRISGAAGAWLGTLAVCVTAPYFFHTFTIYPEIIGSFCVMCGVSLLLDLDDGVEPRTPMLIGVATGLAILPWLHSRFAVIAAFLGASIVIRLLARTAGVRRALTFSLIPAVAAVGWFAFFWAIWGSPSPTAPYGADTSTSPAYILRGLIGLLFDQQYGIVTTAPVYAAAFVGGVTLLRRRSRFTVELSLVVVAYACAVASYAMWWAGSAAPARFLVSILPLAALPISLVVHPLTIIGLLASAWLIVPRVFVDGGRLIFNSRGTFDPTLDWLSPIADLTTALPSVHRTGGSIAVRDAVIWAVLLAIAVVIVRAAGRVTAGARWSISVAAGALAAMVAAAVVWQLHGDNAIRIERSKLAALTAFRRDTHVTLVDISGLRLATMADLARALTFDVAPRARLNRFPAGEYSMTAVAGTRLGLQVGRNDPPFDSAEITNPFVFRLPVSAQSLTFQSDAPVTVTPAVIGDGAVINRNAIRAARYGSLRAFIFDEHAYLESGGIWTRGRASVDVVIAADQARREGLPIAVTAGGADTTIDLSVGDWRQSLSLASGQHQTVTLPSSASGVWRLSIRSGPGFRPSERDPGNRDVRLLAAWITFP